MKICIAFGKRKTKEEERLDLLIKAMSMGVKLTPEEYKEAGLLARMENMNKT